MAIQSALGEATRTAEEGATAPPFAVLAALTGAMAAMFGAALWFWVERGGSLTFDLAGIICF